VEDAIDLVRVIERVRVHDAHGPGGVLKTVKIADDHVPILTPRVQVDTDGERAAVDERSDLGSLARGDAEYGRAGEVERNRGESLAQRVMEALVVAAEEPAACGVELRPLMGEVRFVIG